MVAPHWQEPMAGQGADEGVEDPPRVVGIGDTPRCRFVEDLGDQARAGVAQIHRQRRQDGGCVHRGHGRESGPVAVQVLEPLH